LSVNAFNPQSWNRYIYVLNNPLLYVDPLGLWEIYYKDVEEEKKGNDGKITKVFVRREIYVKKSKDGDNGASLAKQLGLKGKDAEKFAAKIGNGDNIRLSEQGGDVGRVFKGVEKGLTEQVKWEAKNPGKGGGPYNADCSETACNIGFNIGNLQSFSVQEADKMLLGETFISDGSIMESPGASSVSASDAKVGDIVRWADSNNKPKHFANFIFTDDSGQPVVFSKSGGGGRYEYGTTNEITSAYDYGSVRGINKGDTGFYRPKR